MTYEEWKKENEKQLIQEFIDSYEDMFEEDCKAKYDSK